MHASLDRTYVGSTENKFQRNNSCNQDKNYSKAVSTEKVLTVFDLTFMTSASDWGRVHGVFHIYQRAPVELRKTAPGGWNCHCSMLQGLHLCWHHLLK